VDQGRNVLAVASLKILLQLCVFATGAHQVLDPDPMSELSVTTLTVTVENILTVIERQTIWRKEFSKHYQKHKREC